jgi:hypothetical protein
MFDPIAFIQLESLLEILPLKGHPTSAFHVDTQFFGQGTDQPTPNVTAALVLPSGGHELNSPSIVGYANRSVTE